MTATVESDPAIRRSNRRVAQVRQFRRSRCVLSDFRAAQRLRTPYEYYDFKAQLRQRSNVGVACSFRNSERKCQRKRILLASRPASTPNRDPQFNRSYSGETVSKSSLLYAARRRFVRSSTNITRPIPQNGSNTSTTVVT
jgi:hypothetical protein